ncbi:MAG TPA: tRNA (guanosine(46)-N7)-methyltransferase TrmB [Myxococcota bacterium]|jgi:tRNA (guanine-N7-)-methyltransferase
MSRTLKTDIPGPDRRVTIEDVRAKGWDALFAPELRAPIGALVVEIGFGRGEFLRELAVGEPSVPHLGVELSWKRVLKMARRIAKAGDPNIRMICARGEDVVRDALEDASVRTFWINFSDPWPKARHHRRRLVQAPLVHQLAKRLLPGGLLHIATDDVPYAKHIDEVLRAEPLLENALPAPFLPEIPGRLVTAYEAMWRAEGRPLHFFSHRRRAP